MKKQLFLMAIYFVINLHGAQKLTTNENDMLDFIDSIGGKQKLAIYHDSTDSYSNKSLRNIMHAFIEKQQEKKEHCLVYRREMHLHVQKENWQVCDKDIDKLFRLMPRAKGLAMYGIRFSADDDHFSSSVAEIKSLMQAGWIVCADVYDQQFARDLSREFKDYHKEVLIKGYLKNNFFSSVLKIGGVFFIFALFCYKFGITKK